MTKENKALLDFDGTLTDEEAQAAELVGVGIEMLAEVLGCSSAEVEFRYLEIKGEILRKPHEYSWWVNGLPACYAYEGAYLLNTVVLQQILKTDPCFLEIISQKYPEGILDPVTSCTNDIFHRGSFAVNPHFLPGVREFLLSLMKSDSIEPVIFTNSETRKIARNLKVLSISEDEIGILGDTRQYFLDPNWKQTFEHPDLGQIQTLPINDQFGVELRRPVYHAALVKEMARGYRKIVVVADGFSLAGSLPLMMGLSFVLCKTGRTPDWAEKFVADHPDGLAVRGVAEMEKAIKEWARS